MLHLRVTLTDPAVGGPQTLHALYLQYLDRTSCLVKQTIFCEGLDNTSLGMGNVHLGRPFTKIRANPGRHSTNPRSRAVLLTVLISFIYSFVMWHIIRTVLQNSPGLTVHVIVGRRQIRVESATPPVPDSRLTYHILLRGREPSVVHSTARHAPVPDLERARLREGLMVVVDSRQGHRLVGEGVGW